MSTDLTTIQNQLPADVRAALAAQVADDIARLGSTGKDTIRVSQDKKFELPNGEILDELSAVVVDFVYRNEYYPGVFNRKDIKPPTCFAIASNNAELAPSKNSPMIQSDGGCAKCQWNQYGSSPSGDGKACKNTVYLALLPTDATPDSPVWTLKTSPTAIKHFNAYAAKIAHTAQVPVGAVSTRIFFDPAQSYASVRFEAMGANQVYGVTSVRAAEARALLMQEPELTSEAKAA